ncbi:MAG: MarR family transcriptional regulator [Desulfobacteraceae bacterium]|nr:MarR family transcriptional regulator [Desulfobacteraceae bacterium]
MKQDQTTPQVEEITRELRCSELLLSLRKIIRAISLHSKYLNRKYGITGPQLMVLQEISTHDQISVTALAKSISLSQATATDIVNRLEKRELLTKIRSNQDKRRIIIKLSEKCLQILEQAPPPLQKTFIKRFSNLEEWEQLMILSAMKRVVLMMAAEKIDASPILAAGSITGFNNTTL